MNDGLLSFLLVCLLIELTPGPNMAYLAMISSMHGRKAGFSMVAGISAGLLAVGLVSALGAAALVLEKPAIYHSLRGAGILYLWHGTAGGRQHSQRRMTRILIGDRSGAASSPIS